MYTLVYEINGEVKTEYFKSLPELQLFVGRTATSNKTFEILNVEKDE